MNYTTFKQLLLEKIEEDYYCLGTDFLNYLYYLETYKLENGPIFSKDQLTFVSEESPEKQIYEKDEDFPVVFYFDKEALIKFFELEEESPVDIVKSVQSFELNPNSNPGILKKIQINLDIIDNLLEFDLNKLANSLKLNKVNNTNSYDSIINKIKNKISTKTVDSLKLNTAGKEDEIKISYNTGQI